MLLLVLARCDRIHLNPEVLDPPPPGVIFVLVAAVAIPIWFYGKHYR